MELLFEYSYSIMKGNPQKRYSKHESDKHKAHRMVYYIIILVENYYQKHSNCNDLQKSTQNYTSAHNETV